MVVVDCKAPLVLQINRRPGRTVRPLDSIRQYDRALMLDWCCFLNVVMKSFSAGWILLVSAFGNLVVGILCYPVVGIGIRYGMVGVFGIGVIILLFYMKDMHHA